jgi:hypothetical protein
MQLQVKDQYELPMIARVQIEELLYKLDFGL